jgi:hypothetical protein
MYLTKYIYQNTQQKVTFEIQPYTNSKRSKASITMEAQKQPHGED